MPQADIHAVLDYYENNSYPSTRARDANFKGKGKRFLHDTLQASYNNFCTAHPAIQIGRRRFEMLKPPHIQVVGRHDRIVCMCQRHANAKLAVGALIRFRAEWAAQGVIWTHACPTTPSDMAAAIICKPTRPRDPDSNDGPSFLDTSMDCIMGKCKSCGVKKLDDYIKVRLQSSSSRADVQVQLRALQPHTLPFPCRRAGPGRRNGTGTRGPRPTHPPNTPSEL